MFYAKTYKEVYDFDDPPIHDPCAVFCALHPEFFQVTPSAALRSLNTSNGVLVGSSTCGHRDLFDALGRTIGVRCLASVVPAS